MSIIIFLLILVILVLVHEFGHFIAAKLNGVLVEEFGVGFPPRVYGKKYGETIYSLNALPIGGFVKLHGEEYQEKIVRKERAFAYKHPFNKSLIIVSGVLMNVLLGVIIVYITLNVNQFRSEPLPLIQPYHFRFGRQIEKTVVAGYMKDSPVHKAGVEIGDIVTRYRIADEVSLNVWQNVISTKQFINFVRSSEGKKISIELENSKDGTIKVIEVIPKYKSDLKRAIIGVNLVEAAVIDYQNEKILSGLFHSYNIIALNVNSIKFLFGMSVASKSAKPVSEAVAGPLGIFGIVDDILKTSGKKVVINLLNLTSLLSLSLAIVNIFPFPALDGGRFVMVLYEWISGRRVNKTVEKYINLIGFITIISLAILISLNDITKIL